MHFIIVQVLAALCEYAATGGVARRGRGVYQNFNFQGAHYFMFKIYGTRDIIIVADLAT